MIFRKAIRRFLDDDSLQNLGEEYHYLPLAEGEIRLLQIKPPGRWKKSGLVRCSIIHTRLADAPNYEAVSYTWGSSTDQSHVICGPKGESLEVTQNCASILERLHYRRKPCLVWIDAISINQQDIAERNAQVAMMGSIYAKSEQVLIDLGDDSEDSDLAIEEMEKIDISTSLTMTPRKAAAIKSLLERPWFTRVWVLQEVYMAQWGQVVCGLNGLDWLELTSWMILGRSDVEKPTSHPYSITMAAEKKVRTYSAKEDLLPLLYRTQYCRSTDPRDKYFALLGMIPDAGAQGLVADYYKSTATVFIELASYLLATNGTAVLACVQAGSTIPGLPSWVPDWSLSPANMTYREAEVGDGIVWPWSGHRAGGDAELALYKILHPPGRPPMLRVRGALVDQVSRIIETFDTQDCDLDELRNTYWRLRSNVTKLSKFQSVYPEDTNELVLWRIVTRSSPISSHIVAEDMNRFWNTDSTGQRRACQDENKLRHQIRVSLHNQALCLTSDCFLALLPTETRVGDSIVTILGCPMPVVVRPQGDKWIIIGQGYADSVMLGIQIGAAFRNAEEAHREEPPAGTQDFLIV